MVSRTTLLLAVAGLLPTLASAQFDPTDLANYPTCFLLCLNNYLDTTSCLYSNDMSCVCTDFAFLKPMARCLKVSCTPAQADQIWDQTKSDCIVFDKPLPKGAPDIWIGGNDGSGSEEEPSGTFEDLPEESGGSGGTGGSGGKGGDSKDKGGLSTAAIIGIVVGAVLVVSIVAIAAICITRSKSRQRKLALAAATAAAASASATANKPDHQSAPPAFATAGKPTYNPHTNPHQQPLMQHDHLGQQNAGYAAGYYPHGGAGDPEKHGAFVGVAPVGGAGAGAHRPVLYQPPSFQQPYQPQPAPTPLSTTGGSVAPPPPPPLSPPPQPHPQPQPRPQVEQVGRPQQQRTNDSGVVYMSELPPAENVVRAEMMGTVPDAPQQKKSGFFGMKKSNS